MSANSCAMLNVCALEIRHVEPVVDCRYSKRGCALLLQEPPQEILDLFAIPLRRVLPGEFRGDLPILLEGRPIGGIVL